MRYLFYIILFSCGYVHAQQIPELCPSNFSAPKSVQFGKGPKVEGRDDFHGYFLVHREDLSAEHEISDTKTEVAVSSAKASLIKLLALRGINAEQGMLGGVLCTNKTDLFVYARWSSSLKRSANQTKSLIENSISRYPSPQIDD